MPNSQAVGTWSLIGCIDKANEVLSSSKWLACESEPRQAQFLSEFLAPGLDGLRAGLVTPDELKAKADRQAAPLNDWLARNGFEIKLNDFAPNELGFASIFKLGVQWEFEGTELSMDVGSDTYSYVKLESGLQVYTPAEHAEPVAKISTRSGDAVFMTVYDNPPSGFELVREAERISRALTAPSADYEGLYFPKINLDVQPDVSWLIGMHTYDAAGTLWRISQAVQQAKLKMNHIGALVEEAAAIAVESFCIGGPSPLFIDRPFLFWIERNGLVRPLFTAHLCQDVWADPGTLDFSAIKD